jgi:hypothetical protein
MPDRYENNVIIKRVIIMYLTLNKKILFFNKKNKKTKGIANKGPLLPVSITADIANNIPNKERVVDFDEFLL